MTAKTEGGLKLDVVVAAMRSPFPDYRAVRQAGKSASAYVVQRDDLAESGEPETGPAVEPVVKKFGLASQKGEDLIVRFSRLQASVLSKLWKWKEISGWRWKHAGDYQE